MSAETEELKKDIKKLTDEVRLLTGVVSEVKELMGGVWNDPKKPGFLKQFTMLMDDVYGPEKNPEKGLLSRVGVQEAFRVKITLIVGGITLFITVLGPSLFRAAWEWATTIPKKQL